MRSNASFAPRFSAMLVLSPSGFVRLGWTEWGPAISSRVAVCVHGLTRNSRDFDMLARALAGDGWRVLAVDVPGRGRSEWLRRGEDYSYSVYATATAALLGRLDTDSVAWIGTSMGGIIGMMLAAQPATPIKRLVLNDVGALVPKDAIARIAAYIGRDAHFANLAELEAHLRKVHAPFGPLTDAEWRHLATFSSAPAENGKLRLHYDPAIAKAIKAVEPADAVLWPIWEAIACPTLILRGAESDILLRDTAVEMTTRGIAAKQGLVTVRELPGIGHAPALMAADQIDLIRDFLNG
jgi:pimeloyl-ACP methyl ester carboxylesterase